MLNTGAKKNHHHPSAQHSRAWRPLTQFILVWSLLSLSCRVTCAEHVTDSNNNHNSFAFIPRGGGHINAPNWGRSLSSMEEDLKKKKNPAFLRRKNGEDKKSGQRTGPTMHNPLSPLYRIRDEDDYVVYTFDNLPSRDLDTNEPNESHDDHDDLKVEIVEDNVLRVSCRRRIPDMRQQKDKQYKKKKNHRTDPSGCYFEHDIPLNTGILDTNNIRVQIIKSNNSEKSSITKEELRITIGKNKRTRRLQIERDANGNY